MKGIMLGLYNDFQCLADKCNYTCCSGWRIVAGDEDFNRFKSIKNKPLRDNILSNIYESDGVKYFSTRSNGRCSMLDNDGLCRIQKNTSEEMLCNTCRKFPRLVSKHNGLLWISMAASCPVTAEYIVNKKTEFYMINNKGDISAMCVQDIPFIAGEIQEYTKLLQSYITDIKTAKDYINIYKLFMDIADNVLEVIIENKETIYLNGCFDYFEEEKNAGQIVLQFEKFHNLLKEKYSIALDNYLKYRIFSRYLEMPEEKKEERAGQVYGELALICTVALSRYFTMEKDAGNMDLEIVINWVYRLCVHSLRSGVKIHNMFVSFY